MGHITLEIPLGLLPVGRLSQSHDSGFTWRQMLGEMLDGPVLSCGIPSLKNDEDLLVLLDQMFLEFDEFDLDFPEILVVLDRFRERFGGRGSFRRFLGFGIFGAHGTSSG